MKVEDMKINKIYKLKSEQMDNVLGLEMCPCRRCEGRAIFTLSDLVYAKKINEDKYEVYFLCHSCHEITYDYINKEELEFILKTYEFKIGKAIN